MLDKRRFLVQGLLLTAVSLLLRTVGVTAQVYISARIGAEAVGISSLIGGVSGFAITLALSGIGLGCTRLVSEGIGNRDVPFILQTLKCALTHACVFGGISAALLLLGAPTIAALWIRDLRTVSSLRLMALALPFVAISSCLSGYFVAVRRVWKSACMQVAEELLRVLCTLILLSRYASQGLEAALLSLAVANAIADISSGVILLLLFLHDKRRFFHDAKHRRASHPYTGVARKLLSVTLPIAIAAYARSGLITLEHMLIPIGLERFGDSQQAALSSYGSLQSMALPVVLFPCALLGAFASLIVPEMTEAHVRGEYTRIRAMMQRVFSMTLLFSLGTAGVMMFFSHELGMTLYSSEQAAHNIRMLAPLIPVMYMDSATDAMLKGLGQQVYSMKINIADACLSVALVWLLVPNLGMLGYVITIYATELFNAALSIARLLSIGALRPRLIPWVAKPLIAIVGATALTRLLLRQLPSLLAPPAALATYILLACLIYVTFLLLLGALRPCDIQWLKTFILPNKRADEPQ